MVLIPCLPSSIAEWFMAYFVVQRDKTTCIRGFANWCLGFPCVKCSCPAPNSKYEKLLTENLKASGDWIQRIQWHKSETMTYILELIFGKFLKFVHLLNPKPGSSAHSYVGYNSRPSQRQLVTELHMVSLTVPEQRNLIKKLHHWDKSHDITEYCPWSGSPSQPLVT